MSGEETRFRRALDGEKIRPQGELGAGSGLPSANPGWYCRHDRREGGSAGKGGTMRVQVTLLVGDVASGHGMRRRGSLPERACRRVVRAAASWGVREAARCRAPMVAVERPTAEQPAAELALAEPAPAEPLPAAGLPPVEAAALEARLALRADQPAAIPRLPGHPARTRTFATATRPATGPAPARPGRRRRWTMPTPARSMPVIRSSA